jgi:hypothetical protein
MHVLRFWLYFILMVAVPALAAAADATPDESPKYGKTLIAEYELPPEQIEKFANFSPSKPDPNESTVINSLMASTEDWVGRQFKPDTTKNPYTLVLTIAGTARADGDVVTMWQSGWQDDSGMKRMVPFAGMAKSGVKAGEAVTITGTASPASFLESTDRSPVIGLVRAQNFDFTSAKVQLWSGLPGPTKTESFFSVTWLLVGLVMLVLVWWFRSR